MLPQPSVVYAAANDAISYDPATSTVTIRGNCDTGQIYAFMHEDPQDSSSGTGKDATTLHFAGTSVIQTLQYDPGQDPRLARGPFKQTELTRITADTNAQVTFAGKDANTAPVLTAFFASCSSLSSLGGLSAWDVGNVSGNYCMYCMFQDCTNLTSLDGLSAWDVSRVSGDFCMEYMFKGCSSLTSLDGLSAWDVSGVSGDGCMSSMFNSCSGLTSLDGLSAWNVGNVSGSVCMENMFYNCTNLTSLDGLSAWDVGNVSGDYCMTFMFYNCTNLTSLDGLSAWDVGNVSDYGCMQYMFGSCTNLTSLDGLSAWDVSNVQGDYCMQYMFYNCTNLVSLDAIASWNINNAIKSSSGVNQMFSGCTNIASITLGGANGFKLDSIMSLPSVNWWPVDDTSASPQAIDTASLVSESQNPSTLASLRWQRCADGSSVNPMKTVTDLQVSWPQTNADKEGLIYNGLFQTLGTKDNKVQVTATIDGQTDPVTLAEGADFYVVYKDAAGTDTTAIKDAGDYSARIVLRGAYTGQDSESVEVTMQQLDLASDIYSLAAFTLPNRFSYTGSAHTPKTMVRLYLRDDPNPKDSTKFIPIYCYLVENTDKRPEGDYSVSYSSDEGVGTAIATVSPATPEGHSQSNLKNTVNAYFAIGDVFVSFDSCGGSSVPEQGTTNGGKIKVPAQPTKQGYIFNGWYKENTYTTKWDFTIDTVTSDITLYAKWVILCTVTFNSNGGSEVDAQTVAEGSTATEPDNPTREGYAFLYWCTDASLTDKFNFATPITADITLYAKWEETPDPTPPAPDTISITFSTAEGSWQGLHELTIEGEPDQLIVTPQYPEAPADKTCIGWFDEAGKQVISGQTTFAEVTGTVTARYAYTLGWHQNSSGWWYVYDLNNNYYINCWALIHGAWFYFTDQGYCLESCWGYINNVWYYFAAGGYMQTGWQYLNHTWYFLDRYTGEMKTGWQKDGVWYYLSPETGAMYNNCWAYINGAWYGFNEGGSITQGWSYSYAYNGWFYLQPDTGHMLYGWQYIGGHWYYFYDNGLMAANTRIGTYRLGPDGAWS